MNTPTERPGTQGPRLPIPIVLDTDIGTDVDDALALVLALASPELDLQGVTVVDGDVGVRARLAARLLGMAGRPDVPVYQGASRPIGLGRMPTWFGHEGRGVLDRPWDGPEATIHAQPAADWLVERSRLGGYHLVAVGPFTNVARAVTLDPTLPSRLLGLTVMGGMVHPETYQPQWRRFFDETGLPPNHMDHNTASDVAAALLVARAGFDMTWVTAELTFCTTLDRSVMERLATSPTALGRALAAMLHIWSDEYFHVIPRFPATARPFPERAVAALHDPLALASVFGGPWLTTRAHRLAFASEGDLFRIDEVPDLPSGTAARSHIVSVAVDHEAFAAFVADRIGHFLERLPPARSALDAPVDRPRTDAATGYHLERG